MGKIKIRFSQSADKRGVFGYALTVESLSAEGMPTKIFVFHQYPSGVDGNTIAEFSHIASPVDIQEIPEDAATETIPWYRTDKCTVWIRSISDLEQAKQLFVDDISALQRSYDTLTSVEDFTKQTTIEFANGTCHGEDSSSSGSGSSSGSESSSSSGSDSSSPYDD